MTKKHNYPATRRFWTKEEDDFLRRHYGLQTASELAAQLNRPFGSTQSHILALGLKKDAAFYQDKQRCKRFVKGVPNPGAGRNAAPIGTERIDAFGYILVRVEHADGKQRNWLPKHHLVWQEHTGHLPPDGHVLLFKDGDKRNFAINNLELLTQAENMARNSFFNLPEGLQKCLRLKGAIKRRLKHEKFKQQA